MLEGAPLQPAIPPQTQTIRIHDNASCFLHDQGRSSNVPAVHPDVVVNVSRTCSHLAHANGCCSQSTDPGTTPAS